MKLSTRLILALLPTVAGVMFVYALWAVKQRTDALTWLAESETRAYAAALGHALDNAFLHRDLEEVQALVDLVGREPRVHGVLLYGPDGRAVQVSNGLGFDDASPVDAVLRAVEAEDDLELRRLMGEEDVFSVLRPVRGDQGTIIGILEVTHPLSFVDEEIARTGQRFALNTLTLLVVVAVLITTLVRRLIGQPLDQLAKGIRSLGSGNLSKRVDLEPGGREPRELVQEFNRIAEQLERARTALVREIEERVAIEHQAREAEKLAAFGTLAAGVAHQIASPLNVIAGRARMLSRRDFDDSARRRNLETIESEIDRIGRIVRNLLDFSRRPEARIRNVDLVSLVRRTRELLDGQLRDAQVDFRVRGPAALWVKGDPDLLQEVLVILILNAIEALQEVEGERLVCVDLGSSDGHAVLRVRDTGPGMPEERWAQIFDPFFTTKPGGTGLGLAVAQSIVKQLGGELRGRNAAPGQPPHGIASMDSCSSESTGAVFEFDVPVAMDSREEANV